MNIDELLEFDIEARKAFSEYCKMNKYNFDNYSSINLFLAGSKFEQERNIKLIMDYKRSLEVIEFYGRKNWNERSHSENYSTDIEGDAGSKAQEFLRSIK